MRIIYFLLVGLQDCYAQIKKAEKELEMLRPAIINSIKNELLVQHEQSQKSSIRRSENIQKALDKCSEEVWKVFEYEKEQQKEASLNDWVLNDQSIKSLFTHPIDDIK